MMLNDYQKKLIAEGFYSRLKEESTSDKKIALILEFMESFIPKGLPSTIHIPREGTQFDPLFTKTPEQWYQASPSAFTATKKDC
jgi:hypothetical protein